MSAPSSGSVSELGQLLVALSHNDLTSILLEIFQQHHGLFFIENRDLFSRAGKYRPFSVRSFLSFRPCVLGELNLAIDCIVLCKCVFQAEVVPFIVQLIRSKRSKLFVRNLDPQVCHLAL
jgi:hypothetical protein